jgi:hypothetical protein
MCRPLWRLNRPELIAHAQAQPAIVRKFADAAYTRNRIMDVEHINAIGTALADLTQRTQALRGYL